MCGIAGKLDFRGRSVDRALLVRMGAALAHRGPDDENVYASGPVGLSQRRLSIIDLSESACAPLSNEDGTLWVVFNGEIYNFQALRADLVARGHRFATNSDTEVLVHLYQEYGDGFVARLRGMFAFAIWDERRQRLFAARDRLGKKPLTYLHNADGFWFASQAHAIAVDPEVVLEPDYAAIDLYFSRQYVPSPLSAFRGFRKLPPGHTLSCEANGELRIDRYWQPPAYSPGASRVHKEELQQELVRQLDEAVRLRLIADVPLGALLSGGIDSAAVVALMARNVSAPVKTYSIGFRELEFNELDDARRIASRFGTDHHEFIVDLDATGVLEEIVGHYNEPFADPSAIPTWFVSKLAAQHVKVVLSGDGGDENFAGYAHYQSALQWQNFDRVPANVRRVAAAVGAAGTSALPLGSTVLRARNWFDLLGSDWPERYREHTALVKLPERRALYAARMRSLGLPEPHPAMLDVPPVPGEDPVAWMMRYDQTHYLPDCLMTKTDIASMAHSLEVRCPFLDHVFVEFAATVPSELKLAGGQGKRILKDALRTLLPEETLTRRKTGFGIPLATWLRTGLAPMMRDLLLGESARQRGLFRLPVVEMMIQQHLAGSRDWSGRLWSLLWLELWFRRFIDRRHASAQ